MKIPIIDLFAGPGGLAEGFSSLKNHKQQPVFEIGLSIEKDAVAHRTLTLRAVYRRLYGTEDVKHYYSYIRGEIDEETFRKQPAVANAFMYAVKEARCLELGKADEKSIDEEIRVALGGRETWVLIGGPPCQAYSLAGRSRRTHDKTFHKDEKHFLYKEYLRIIQVHRPTIFVMENVKGLLSSQHSGSSIFEKIVEDLSKPAEGVEYEIRSFVKRGDSHSLEPSDYVIQAEFYGIPQSRHRVILLGVRKDAGVSRHKLLSKVPELVTVKQAIEELPRLRSRLSKADSLEAWRKAVQSAHSFVNGWGTGSEFSMMELMRASAAAALDINVGKPFIQQNYQESKKSTELQLWLHDKNLGGFCQHEARSHMASDLARYLFAACFAQSKGYSPGLDLFPEKLLPNHLNVQGNKAVQAIPFKDRFRVQCEKEPSSTVVAHIAKDGHYYIHYDPTQCRSLTVREAARLQTFPDNYFFAGNRTEQYGQVGNAVPPLLANKLAKVVRGLLAELNRERKRKSISGEKKNLIDVRQEALREKTDFALAEAQ